MRRRLERFDRDIRTGEASPSQGHVLNVVRVTGGLHETVLLPGYERETTRGAPFRVPDELATRLMEDGTGRWQAAPTDPPPKAAKAVQAKAPSSEDE